MELFTSNKCSTLGPLSLLLLVSQASGNWQTSLKKETEYTSVSLLALDRVHKIHNIPQLTTNACNYDYDAWIPQTDTFLRPTLRFGALATASKVSTMILQQAENGNDQPSGEAHRILIRLPGNISDVT